MTVRHRLPVTVDPDTLGRGDVLRAYRYGNRTKGNYVIARVLPTPDHIRDLNAVSVMAHREHGGGRDDYMLLDLHGARVIRSYR